MRRGRNGSSFAKAERKTLHQVHTPECGKRGYQTRADAKKALRHHRKRGFSRGVRPYECPACGFWHLGHVPYAVKVGFVDEATYFAR